MHSASSHVLSSLSQAHVSFYDATELFEDDFPWFTQSPCDCFPLSCYPSSYHRWRIECCCTHLPFPLSCLPKVSVPWTQGLSIIITSVPAQHQVDFWTAVTGWVYTGMFFTYMIDFVNYIIKKFLSKAMVFAIFSVGVTRTLKFAVGWMSRSRELNSASSWFSSWFYGKRWTFDLSLTREDCVLGWGHMDGIRSGWSWWETPARANPVLPAVGRCKWTPDNLGLLGPGVFYGLSFFLHAHFCFSFFYCGVLWSGYNNYLIDKN